MRRHYFMKRPRPRRITSRPLLENLFETLESRILFNGVTIITHGYEPFSNARPSWIDAMGNAIATRAGPTTAIYTLRLEPTDANTVHVSAFTHLSGPTSAASADGQTIILLDWASVSGIITQDYSTTYLASVVTPYLEQAFPNIGIDAPLADQPIQLIGHSRGVSLVSQIATDLGHSGIWVDQLTGLDNVPGPNDPGVTLTNNVVFSDEYYQNSGDGILTPNGSPIAGAYNVGPLTLGGAYGVIDGTTHSDVHLFYQGTINTSASASDGSFTVPTSWYPNNSLNRNTTGFYYTLIGGGSRPSSGLSASFGGTAVRTTDTRSGAQWPNLETVVPSTSIIETGQSFSVSYRYQDFDSSATIQWFLDTDQNPDNNNSIALDSPTAVASSSGIVSANQTLTFSGAAGTYYLEGVITDGTNTRYSYETPFTVSLPVHRLVFSIAPPANITAGTPFGTVVQIEDAGGNILTDDNSTVTLSLSGTAGGTVGGTITVPANAGVATFTGLSITKAGTYTLTASDGALLPATSTTFTVSPDLTSAQLYLQQQPHDAMVGTTLLPSIIVGEQDRYGNPITSDQSIVTLSSNDPQSLTGITSVALKNGIATFSNIKAAQAGTYVISLSDAMLPAAPAVQFTQNIDEGVTKLAKPVPAATYNFGKTIILQTTLHSTAPLTVPFTGLAAILDASGNPLGTATLTAGGLAKFELTDIAPGTYTCTVDYAGDANHTAATSGTFTLHVVLSPSTTTLQVAAHSLFYGEPLTLTATVNSPSASLTPRTGTVTFKQGSTVLGVVDLAGNTASLTLPSADIATPTVGLHNYTAIYSGDGNYRPDGSPVQQVNIKKDQTQTVLSTSATGPVAPAAPFTLTAVVSSLVVGSTTPTGKVIFKDGTKILGTVTLDNTGKATLVTSLSGLRTHTLTAHYSGDALTTGSISASLLQVVATPVV